MLEACLLCATALVARMAVLQLLVGRHHRLPRPSTGLVTVQLWRRTGLHRPCAIHGERDLPSPRERRVRLTLVAGIPVWRQVEEIGLPIECADRIDLVRAVEFDAAFPVPFRIDMDSAASRSRAVPFAQPSRI